MLDLSGKKIDAIAGEDIEDRPFASRGLTGKALLVGFADRKGGKQMDEVILRVAGRSLHEAAFVQVMDVSGVPALIRKLPAMAIRAGYRTLSEQVAAELQRNHVQTDTDGVRRRLVMYPDWRGEVLDRLGLRNATDRIHLLVVGPDMQVELHVDGWDDSKLEPVFAALERLGVRLASPDTERDWLVRDLRRPLSMDQIKEVVFHTPGFFLCDDPAPTQSIIAPETLREELFGPVSESRFADVEGIRLAYRDAGAGEAAVLIHGMRDSKHVLQPLAERLSPHLRTISVDLRGHGHSDKPRGPYRTEQMARDVLALLDALEIPRAHLVGHSLGASIAFEAATLAPDRVGRIVAMGSAIREEAPRYRPANPEEMHRDKSFARHAPFLDMLASKFFPTERRGVPVSLIETLRTRVLLGWMMLSEEVSLALATLQRTGLEAALGRVANPILVLVGDLDVVGKLGDAELISQCARQVRIELVEDAGHYMFVEQPEQTAARILRFLGSDQPRGKDQP